MTVVAVPAVVIVAVQLGLDRLTHVAVRGFGVPQVCCSITLVGRPIPLRRAPLDDQAEFRGLVKSGRSATLESYPGAICTNGQPAALTP